MGFFYSDELPTFKFCSPAENDYLGIHACRQAEICTIE